MRAADRPAERLDATGNGKLSPVAGNSEVKVRVGGSLGLLPSLLVLALAGVGGAARHPWVLIVCVFLAVAGLFFNKPPIRASLMFLWWAGMLFFVWHLFTLAPLPVKSLGSPRTEYFERAHEKLAELNEIMSGGSGLLEGTDGIAVSRGVAQGVDGGSVRSGRLTLNQAGTRRFIVIAIGAWAMFWLTTSMSHGQRLRFMGFLVVGGAIVAGLGILGRHAIPFGNRIWWLFPTDHAVGGGPFVNRNHFASFCAILAPVALSLILAPTSLFRTASRPANDFSRQSGVSTRPSRISRGRSSRRRGRDRKWGSWVDWWRSLSQLGRWRLVYGVSFGLLAAASILSLSRGGMVMLLIGCLACSLFWVGSRPSTALAGTVLVIGLLFAFVLWPSQAVQNRISTIRHLYDASPRRAQMTREAFRQWRDFPLLGGGADSFRVLNGVYRVDPATTSPLYAENEYAQILADHGLLGAMFFLTLTVGLLIGLWGNFHSRFQRTRSLRVLRGTWADDPEIARRHMELYGPVVSLPILAAAAGVVVGLMFHFSGDFPARVPLNAFLAASLLGLAMPLPENANHERGTVWRWPLRLFFAFSFSALIFWSGQRLRLDEPAYLERDSVGVERLQAAILAAPSYWVPWSELSYLLRAKSLRQLYGENLSADDRFDPFRLYGFGAQCLEVATELSPRDWRLWRELARIRMSTVGAAPHQVDELWRRAARLAPDNLTIWLDWLSFALSGPYYRQIQEIGELAAGESTPRVGVGVWREIRAWARREKFAAYEYQAVLRLTELQPRRRQWWSELARLAQADGDGEVAIGAWRRVAELQPENWRNWWELGKRLLESGADDEANRAFQQAIRLHPPIRERVDEFWRDFKLSN